MATTIAADTGPSSIGGDISPPEADVSDDATLRELERHLARTSHYLRRSRLAHRVSAVHSLSVTRHPTSESWRWWRWMM
jgi:hypothetical protein